jgi:hypothetical protein
MTNKERIATAAAKRDTAIQEARFVYRREVREIRAAVRLSKSAVRIPLPAIDDSLRDHTALAAAESVLFDRGEPCWDVDLVIEMQARGCRAGDDPQAVLNAVRSGFRYHPHRFWQDAEGRWSAYT